VFLDSVNRGRFLRPTDTTFMLVLRRWRVYEEIRRSSTLQKKLLGAANQRSLFVEVMGRAQELDLNTVDDLIASEPFCIRGFFYLNIGRKGAGHLHAGKMKCNEHMHVKNDTK